MGSRGQIRVMESRGKVEGQKVETRVRREVRQPVCAEEQDVGGQLLAIQRQQRKLVCMVNDIIEELVDLDMEPKPELLWWTSTHEDEDSATLKVVSRSHTWDLPLKDVFDVLGYRFHQDWKGAHGTEKTLRKGMGSWWRDGYICCSKSVPMKTKCQRVVSHVFSTALNSSINWPWTVTTLTKVRLWESQIQRLTLRPKRHRK